MEAWLEWARGPAFIFSFAFLVLGLLRHVVLTFWEVFRVWQRAGDKKLPLGKLLRTTVLWLLPVTRMRNRFWFGLTSFVFHVCILIVPVFLAGHIALWARGLGLSWPAVPNAVADALTILAVVSAVLLFAQRALSRATRSLSRLQDYALLPLIAVPFVTGFLMMHPAINPFGYQGTFFVHIMSANLLFVLTPLTKLSHMVLMPSSQLVAELAWHWPAGSGSAVERALGKEGEPV
jgi:nitrate reductase gamma subunit